MQKRRRRRRWKKTRNERNNNSHNAAAAAVAQKKVQQTSELFLHLSFVVSAIFAVCNVPCAVGLILSSFLKSIIVPIFRKQTRTLSVWLISMHSAWHFSLITSKNSVYKTILWSNIRYTHTYTCTYTATISTLCPHHVAKFIFMNLTHANRADSFVDVFR